VRIYEFDRSHRLSAISRAEKGEYAGPNSWKLSNVELTRFEGDRAVLQRLPHVFRCTGVWWIHSLPLKRSGSLRTSLCCQVKREGSGKTFRQTSIRLRQKHWRWFAGPKVKIGQAQRKR
jgi:hypothetical protein